MEKITINDIISKPFENIYTSNVLFLQLSQFAEQTKIMIATGANLWKHSTYHLSLWNKRNIKCGSHIPSVPQTQIDTIIVP